MQLSRALLFKEWQQKEFRRRQKKTSVSGRRIRGRVMSWNQSKGKGGVKMRNCHRGRSFTQMKGLTAWSQGTEDELGHRSVELAVSLPRIQRSTWCQKLFLDGNTAVAISFLMYFYICQFSENMHCFKMRTKQRNEVKRKPIFRRMRYQGVFGLEKQN